MAITITTNGTHVLDQSFGLQTSGSADTGDDVQLSTDLNQLPDPFETFLEAISPAISTGQLTYAAGVEAERETVSTSSFFVNVLTTNGETINDLFFSQSNGQLFNGQ